MKRRYDSYESTLTPEQQEDLRVLLLKKNISIKQMRELAPAFGTGERAGTKPSEKTFSKLAKRARAEEIFNCLNNVEGVIHEARRRLNLKATRPTQTQEIEAAFDRILRVIVETATAAKLNHEDAESLKAVSYCAHQRLLAAIATDFARDRICNLILEKNHGPELLAILQGTGTRDEQLEAISLLLFQRRFGADALLAYQSPNLIAARTEALLKIRKAISA